MNYGTSFFEASLDQLYEDEISEVKRQALAVRGSNAEDLEDFYKALETKKAEESDSTHKSQMAMLNKKL